MHAQFWINNVTLALWFLLMTSLPVSNHMFQTLHFTPKIPAHFTKCGEAYFARVCACACVIEAENECARVCWELTGGHLLRVEWVGGCCCSGR